MNPAAAVLLTLWLLAAAVVVHQVARVAHGIDLPARLLALATAGQRGQQAQWGTAMRAELACIDDPRERRRFAVSCALTAVRLDRRALLVATASFVAFGITTLVASRVMLAGDRTGVLAVLFGVPQLLFFGIALTAARVTRSFRTGLEYGVSALLASLAGVLVIAVPESLRWYHEAGVWILDGDSPVGGIPGSTAAMQDALQGLTFFYLLFTAPWPLLGAGLVRVGVGSSRSGP
ncbi:MULTISPECIES: hypothetical protein [unclassified Kribbella]|uniref:hypothetical protein n=1 Tax=unclassified Kribbella TaxID=2644121 RepID=UPI00340C8B99